MSSPRFSELLGNGPLAVKRCGLPLEKGLVRNAVLLHELHQVLHNDLLLLPGLFLRRRLTHRFLFLDRAEGTL